MWGDKESSVVILKRSNYDKKLQSMINEGITNGTCVSTRDSKLRDLKKF